MGRLDLGMVRLTMTLDPSATLRVTWQWVWRATPKTKATFRNSHLCRQFAPGLWENGGQRFEKPVLGPSASFRIGSAEGLTTKGIVYADYRKAHSPFPPTGLPPAPVYMARLATGPSATFRLRGVYNRPGRGPIVGPCPSGCAVPQSVSMWGSGPLRAPM